MSIDLVLLGDSDPIATSWRWGKVYHSNLEINSVNTLISKILDTHGYILFLDSALAIPSPNILEQLVESNIDVAHAGLKFDLASKVDFLDYVSPISYFNLDRSVESEITSWKVSLKCCLVKKDVLQQFPFLNPQFESLDASVLEWGYRLIWRGVIMRYYPHLVNRIFERSNMPIKDQVRFLHAFYGKKWIYWAAIRSIIKLKSFHWAYKALAYKVNNEPKLGHVRNHQIWKECSLASSGYNVSVIIPTVDRYQYLFTLLDQLQSQTIKPCEVIVIDQTAVDKRKSLNIKDYELIGLKLIYLETSGQCSSRNEGLRQSTGNYILFLDDDDEVKPDLIEQHLKCLSYFKADVSCGVCDEVGAGPIPKEYNLIRMSDVFPTNNGMLRRKVLYQSGLFDLTFNRGQKADGDLGARIYKSGAIMILNPEIRVLHHRAPMGGLRKHKVRKVTYSSSRRFVTHFRLPHLTELYFNRQHFTKRQQMEHMWLTMLGTFSIRGGWFKKALNAVWATINFPLNLYKIISRNKRARILISNGSSIPVLTK
ncbi:MAG: glycosyltransferase family 2 protein [Cyclobacteriaceae bacterium]|nr:glycosyltransferase family 2 protein [Cyclobacteriaceae bacterium]